jgi:hypothetical protein
MCLPTLSLIHSAFICIKVKNMDIFGKLVNGDISLVRYPQFFCPIIFIPFKTPNNKHRLAQKYQLLSSNCFKIPLISRLIK